MVSTVDRADSHIHTRIWRLGALAVLGVRGRLDVFSAAEFRERADKTLASDARTLIIDLSGVSHIDSNGISALIAVSDAAAAAGVSLGTIAGSNQMQKLFALVGIDRVLGVERSERSPRRVRASGKG